MAASTAPIQLLKEAKAVINRFLTGAAILAFVIALTIITIGGGSRTAYARNAKGEDPIDKSKEVGKDVVDKTKKTGKAVGEKTVEGAGTVIDKTASTSKAVGEKTVEGAGMVIDKTTHTATAVGSTTKDGAGKVVSVTKAGAKKTFKVVKKVIPH